MSATPPSPSFNGPGTLRVGQSGTFTSTSTDPDVGDSITQVQWNFGDGGSASGGSVQHAYASTGTKTVTMTVTDANGESASTSGTVNVTPNTAPNASFTASPNPARPGQNVNFDASGSNDPDSGGGISGYEWDFDGNGSFETSTGNDPTTSRSFATAGRRTIGLRVTDVDGARASTAISLLVNTPPVASFTARGGDPTPLVPDVGETVTFNGAGSSDTEGPLTKYEWDLDGNGSFETDTGTSSSATTTYPSRGTRNVKLRVTDNLDQKAEVSVPLRINAKPAADVFYCAAAAGGGCRQDAAGLPVRVPLVGEQVIIVSGSQDEESTNPTKNNSITQHLWNIDGVPINRGADPTLPNRAFTTGGDKVVQLVAIDNDQAFGAKEVRIRVNTPPVADFVAQPQTPLRNETVTFNETARDPDDPGLTSPNNGVITKFEWDLDGDGAYDDSTARRPQATFDAFGEKTVGLRVTDGAGATHTVARKVMVVNTRPNAAFDSGPAFPLPGQPVAFTSRSNPTSGESITKTEWDFDYDPARGVFDAEAEGAEVLHGFGSAGTKTVAVRVTQSGQGVSIATGTVVVNAPPQASFNAAPTTPAAGDAITFTSTSADPDGPLTSQQWDTDDDGQFDDASGHVASRTFSQPGSYTVRLRVTDDRGASAVHSGLIRVAAKSAAGSSGGQSSGGIKEEGRALLANVVVQIAGRITSEGARLTLLRVRAPRGSRIKVKCKGEGCPKRATRGRGGRKRLRVTKLERELGAGAKITISVTRKGFIGRYVQFRIRAGKAPKRIDRCLQPGAKRPTACPS